MSIITSRNTWTVDSQEERMKKGKLVKVQIGPGQYVKMYEADAIAKGHIKAKPPAQNKMQPQPQNKMKSPEETKEPETTAADDFTVIPGVGMGTARALVAHGIITFEQLRESAAQNLGFLPEKAAQAIMEWVSRQNDG